MSFWNGLFKKKKGGTFAGNLLRGAWNHSWLGALYEWKPPQT